MTEHHEGDGGEHDEDGADAHEGAHQPASPGGAAVPGPDPYDIESDLGPDGVPTTEPEPHAE